MSLGKLERAGYTLKKCNWYIPPPSHLPSRRGFTPMNTICLTTARSRHVFVIHSLNFWLLSLRQRCMPWHVKNGHPQWEYGQGTRRQALPVRATCTRFFFQTTLFIDCYWSDYTLDRANIYSRDRHPFTFTPSVNLESRINLILNLHVNFVPSPLILSCSRRQCATQHSCASCPVLASPLHSSHRNTPL